MSRKRKRMQPREGPEMKGGVNPPNASDARPPRPGGSAPQSYADVPPGQGASPGLGEGRFGESDCDSGAATLSLPNPSAAGQCCDSESDADHAGATVDLSPLDAVSERRCEACRHFKPASADGLASQLGECRRHPPSFVKSATAHGPLTLFPVVTADCWCGEFATH